MDSVSAAAAELSEIDLSVGDPCLAVYELDQQWYRGVVIEKEPGRLKCRFIDYGFVNLMTLFQE